MNRKCLMAQLVLVLGTGSVVLGLEPKVELNLTKGFTGGFKVVRSLSNDVEAPRGKWKSTEETEIDYRLEVTEKKDNGDLTLKVEYAAIKAKSDGPAGGPLARQRQGKATPPPASRESAHWEFDSSKKEGSNEGAAYLRGIMEKPVTVRVKGGRVAGVEGLPEATRARGGATKGVERGEETGPARNIANRGTLTRDLALIFPSAVAGHALEKGKEFKLESARPVEGTTGGERAGRVGAVGPLPMTFKFEGAEKAGEESALKFSLSGERHSESGPEGAEAKGSEKGGDAGKRRSFRTKTSEKGSGAALFSAKDGLLLTLDLTSEGKTEGEGQFLPSGQGGQGRGLQRSRKVHLTVTRSNVAKSQSPAPKAPDKVRL